MRQAGPEALSSTPQELAEWAERWNLDKEQWRINPITSRHKYGEELHNALFCFTPYGHGWGIRMIQTTSMGCIPVIVQDHVFQYYEDVLPYWKFSIRRVGGGGTACLLHGAICAGLPRSCVRHLGACVSRVLVPWRGVGWVGGGGGVLVPLQPVCLRVFLAEVTLAGGMTGWARRTFRGCRRSWAT
jgi:Exostosin family